MACGKTEADGAAPIVDDQVNAFKTEAGDERGDVVDALGQGVGVGRRLLGEPHAYVIGHDAAQTRSEGLNEVAVVKGPGGIAVQHEHGFGGTHSVGGGRPTLVKVAHAGSARSLEGLRRERIERLEPVGNGGRHAEN